MPSYTVRAVSRELSPMLSLAFPVVIAEVGWMAMQIVDIGMVGRLGPEAIGAVGVGSALFLALSVFAMGLLLGLDTLISQAAGAHQPQECAVWLRHGLLLAATLTVPLTLAARLVASSLQVWGLTPTVFELTTGYFGVVTWSMLPLLLYFALRRYLQAMNCARPVMLTLLSANLINAGANWLLVFGNWGLPRLGVEGAAWATCISRAYMFAMLAAVTWWVHRRSVSDGSAEDQVSPQRPIRRFEVARMRQLLTLGGPAAGQLILEIGVFAAATALAGRLAPQQLAAHQIVLNLAGLTFMVPLGVSAAGAVRVGQAVGRADTDGARLSGWVAIGLGALFMGVAAVLFVAVPRWLLSVFTSDLGVIDVGVLLLRVAAVFQLFDGLQVVATGALRGLGDTRTPMLSNLLGHWVVGLPVGYALCFSWGWGVLGLWVGLSLGIILVGVILVPMWHCRVQALALTTQP